MLKTNFLPAESLGLDEAYHESLVKVLGLLERGELTWVEVGGSKIPNGFNMRHFFTEGACGTAGCIAGWASYFMRQAGQKITMFNMNPVQSEAWYHLTSPNLSYNRSMSSLTVEESAHALRTYLVTGYPEWN